MAPSAAEVALALESGGCQRIRILTVDLFANVYGPRFIHKAGALVLQAQEHIPLGPVIKNPEKALLDLLSLLGWSVVLGFASQAYGVADRRVEESGGPVEDRRVRELLAPSRVAGEAAQRPTAVADAGVYAHLVKQHYFCEWQWPAYVDQIGEGHYLLIVRGNLLINLPMADRGVYPVGLGGNVASGLIIETSRNQQAARTAVPCDWNQYCSGCRGNHGAGNRT